MLNQKINGKLGENIIYITILKYMYIFEKKKKTEEERELMSLT